MPRCKITRTPSDAASAARDIRITQAVALSVLIQVGRTLDDLKAEGQVRLTGSAKLVLKGRFVWMVFDGKPDAGELEALREIVPTRIRMQLPVPDPRELAGEVERARHQLMNA